MVAAIELAPRHPRPVGGMTVCPIAVILERALVSGKDSREFRDRLWCNCARDEDGRDWSQRYKANLKKLASGDLVQVVEVVRDLAGREASRGLSAGEKRMLAKARLILLQEG
jgi:RNA polymerase-interacting CarD/CdnL/TRCF family regulator